MTFQVCSGVSQLGQVGVTTADEESIVNFQRISSEFVVDKTKRDLQKRNLVLDNSLERELPERNERSGGIES